MLNVYEKKHISSPINSKQCQDWLCLPLMLEVEFITRVLAQKGSSLDQKVIKRHKKEGSERKDWHNCSTASLQISCGERKK